MNILTISDEAATIAPIVDALHDAAYNIVNCRKDDANLTDCVQCASLVVVNWRTDGSPEPLLDSLQTMNAGMPVLVLLDGGADVDVVGALDAGADDCLRAPYAMGEFLARVRALARRCTGDLDTLKRGPIVINQRARQAWLNGTPMTLNVREFAILTILIRRADQLVTRKEILAEVWQRSRPPTSNLIEVYIRHLRAKLGAVSVSLQTVRGKGYIFVTQMS